ncbi:MAG: ABC transporter permease [Candidatus Methanomethylophilaceae archaeon]|nr:ABC transporter permease [Candidatus Methanomethylophilaceae archaeon]
MGLIDETFRVALSDLYYFKRNIIILTLTSLVTPLLYMLAFGFGVGSSVEEMDGVSYIAFIIPGVVAINTMTSSFSTISHKLMVQKRFYESFDEMLLCPVSKSALILGKCILGVLKGSICGVILLALGYLMTSDLIISPQLFGMMILSCLIFSLLGVAAGVVLPDLAWTDLFNSFVILPMTFLCGTMFSLSSVPQIVADIIWVLPLTHTSACIRAIALGRDFPWISFVVLMIYGTFFFILSWLALNRNK